MVNMSRRHVVHYAGAAVANIGALSTLGYAASHVFRKIDTDVEIDKIDAGGSDPYVSGAYGKVLNWPIIAIHAILLPGGAVMSYGADENGNQGGFIHDVWDPNLGTGPASHYTVPNGVAEDFFCSASSLLANGTVLIADGDLTINGGGITPTTARAKFNPRTNTMVSGPLTRSARWYPSLVSLPDGSKVLLGGIDSTLNSGPASTGGGTPVLTPKITSSGKSWSYLSGATSAAAFGWGLNYCSNSLLSGQ
jgi:hypothetical protein